jgi:5-oxopent-3-ene-1,2,5-tricarboxylate decarboxylase/2-hydroxyhepta-2,4-diene-1,7-dioate isomerase
VSALPAIRTVYGTLLNSRAEFEAWAPRMNEAPYKGAPKAPVLYIKPANTWSADGADVVVPARIAEVEIGATVGMVMKSPGVVGGYVLMNDFSVPHASYFRPPVKFRCLDGFLGVGQVMDGAGIDPVRSAIEVRVNGALRQTVRFDDLVRAPSQLLADVSEFMTLGAGDVLMLGLGADRPLARPGETVELRAGALGTLTHKLVGTP